MSGGPKAEWMVPLALTPLKMALLLDGRSPGTFFSELTGLSPSRMRPGDERPLRPSTLRRALEHADARLREQLVASRFTPGEVDAFISAMPSRRFGRACPFGDFIHRLSGGDDQVFSLMQGTAGRIDALCDALAVARESGNLLAYIAGLAEVDWLGDLRWWAGGEVPAVEARRRLVEASDWQAVDDAAQVVFLNIWLSFLAAVDSEFSIRNFGRFAPRPLFLDLLPTLGPTVAMGAEIRLPKRDRFRLPPRRLLELCFAVLHHGAHRSWPDSAPSRHDVAFATGYRDVDIGNLYDGTKKLTARIFSDLWRAMTRDFAIPSELIPPSPMPLLIAALAWQSAFVSFDEDAKLKQVVLFDGSEYLTWWNDYRQQLGEGLGSGTVNWPTWLEGPPDVTGASAT